jgi:hypothetical protein
MALFDANYHVLLISGVLIGLASIVVLLWKPKRQLPRVGIDPGPLRLKAWPAAINFAINGNRLVEEGYNKVGHAYFTYLENNTTKLSDMPLVYRLLFYITDPIRGSCGGSSQISCRTLHASRDEAELSTSSS